MDNSSNEEGFKIERRTGTTQTYTQIAIVELMSPLTMIRG